MNIDINKSIKLLEKRLLESRAPHGFWQGHLSSSELSIATAVFALSMADKQISDTNSAGTKMALQKFKQRWRLGRHTVKPQQYQHNNALLGSSNSTAANPQIRLPDF